MFSTITIAVGLDKQNWNSKLWKELSSSLTQEILDDAYSKTPIIISMLSPLGDVEPRKYKPIKEQSHCMFKVVCDLTAVKVNCQVEEIESKLEILTRIVRESDGIMYVDEPLFTQYVYIYLPQVGYITEVQIGNSKN